jgi:hypothetical protein
MSAVWGMGMYNGHLSVKASINVYEALVRSILEYGAQIWGDEEFEEGEKIQREMGRRILRCHGKTSNAAVLGELGWWKLRTRREFIKLKYWINILLMDDSRLVKRVYRISKQAFVDKGTNNWCSQIHKLAFKYQVGFLWEDETLVCPPENKEAKTSNQQLKAYWAKRLQDNVHKKEEIAWKNEMELKPKLRTYKTFKTELRLEKYLLSEQTSSVSID